MSSDKNSTDNPLAGENPIDQAVSGAARPEGADLEEAVPDPVPPTPGEVLRDQREFKALSVQQVADSLHLTRHYVHALESDSYDKLPGEVFARGYIRSYARLLELDPEQVLGLYQQLGERRQARKQEAIKRHARRRLDRNRPWIIVSGIAFVALAVLLWYFNVGVTETGELPEAGTGAPASAQLSGNGSGSGDSQTQLLLGEQPAMAPGADESLLSADGRVATSGDADATDTGRVVELDWGGNDSLALTLSVESWIEVDDRQDSGRFRDSLHAGDQLRIRGTAPFSILLGNARQIELVFNGRVVDVSANVRSDDSARLTLGM